MSDGEKYLVELEFKRNGDFGVEQIAGKLKVAEKGFDAFGRGWTDLRSSVAPVGDAIDSVVRSAMGFAAAGAAAGGAAIFAGAIYGVTTLNNELEQAQIGLGAVFNANGMASTLPAGLERAKDVVAAMRVDAQKLPGEFHELLDIFNTAGVPGFQGGASIDQLRVIAGDAMAAGKIFHMENGQVARELNMLLSGRSGAHNKLGTQLGLSGDEAKKFNAMDQSKQLAKVEELLGKYHGAINEFGNSYDALSSSVVDQIKMFGTTATAPLFEAVKSTLSDANGWFLNNKQEIEQTATTIGYVIRDAYRDGEAAVKHWGPIVYDFAEGAYTKFHAIWYDAEPYVERFASAMESALSDPNGTIDKLGDLLKLYAALKIGEGALGIGGGLLGAANGIGGMMGSAGLLGGGAAGGAAAGGASALAIAGAGAAFITAVGGMTAAIYEWNELQKDIEDEHRKNMRAKAEAAQREITEMVARGESEVLIQQRMNEMHDHFMASGQNLADEMFDVAMASQSAAGALFGLGNSDPGKRDRYNPNAEVNPDMPEYLKVWKTGGYAPVAKEPERNAAGMKHKGGGGGTIQKVEIVVTGNNDPSRVARLVVGHIVRLQRNTGASPDVANYSALENS